MVGVALCITRMLSITFDLIMVVAPVLGYIPQYQKFQKRKSSEGFNNLVCFILLVSNIMRCFFWFGKRFETTLLFQSIVMIIAQLFMLEICTRLAPQEPISRKKTIFDGRLQDFWKWDDFPSYGIFLSFLCLLFVILSMVFIGYPWFVEAIGFASLLLESTLGMPQLYTNLMTGNTSGLSTELIATWFAGDAFKTVYFFQTGAPFQFLMCGLIQLTVDILIFVQIFTSKRPTSL
mmetsp:Transcript_21748/g.30432  ORF Transcript_21748/g.30432 Transcript_21748/m.30432 type:complete len:234 (-) Transcript_21748:27-728(-)